MPESIYSERIKNLPPYLFAEIDYIKRKKIEEGKEIIDLGIGDPDLPTDNLIVSAMIEEVKNSKNHSYPSYEGDFSFRKAFVDWYFRRFRFEFSPSDCIALIGSKEGIAHSFLAFVNPGDIVIIPSPGYPVYGIWTRFAGGVPYEVFLDEEKDFLLDIESVHSDILSRAKMVWVCYPNNPTTACASAEYYDKLSFFVKKYGFVLAIDLAYSEIYTDETKKPVSFFEVVRRRDISAIEFHSFSKTFSMAGWRLGVAVGNPDVISALLKVKTNTDSGVFRAIQLAGRTALENYERITPKIRDVYKSRRQKLESALSEAGFNFYRTNATFYIWVKCNGDSKDFAKELLDKYGIIVTPGIGFGKGGEGYFRISLTIPDDKIEKVCDIIKSIDINSLSYDKEP